MLISVCVIAKDEANSIAQLIESVATQTVFLGHDEFEFVIVCNGCTDDTASVAKLTLNKVFGGTKVKFRVYDTQEAGKSRSWNLAVHKILDPSADIFVFMDADIHINDTEVIAHLLWKLSVDPNVTAVSGWPVKDAALKKRKSVLDHISLTISSQTLPPHAVNGSLYVGLAAELRKIWLPVPTPGEDGFLSAMIHTQGFLKKPEPNRIQRADRPTHYYETHTVAGYLRHERRITIATAINGWIFEKLWEQNSTAHAGNLIQNWNERDPLWVSRLVSSKVSKKRWALPARLLTWRLGNLRGVGLKTFWIRAPLSITATILNIWPTIQANEVIKRSDAASIW